MTAVSPAVHAPPRLGLVVGATDPMALSRARASAGSGAWILAPGVGAQGGDLTAACEAGLDENGTGLLIPVSRGISRSKDRAGEAEKIRDAINAAREAVKSKKSASPSAAREDGGSTTSAPSAARESSASSSTSGPQTEGSIAPYQRRFLQFALSEGVLKFGSFVLKSGRTSPYFFNAGLFSSGAALHRLGGAYASAILASSDL